MTKAIITISLFCLFNTNTNSQELLVPNATANYMSASPEAAGAQKQSTIPVNLSTGIPQISTPLATLQGKTISISYALSYDATGRKVEELAPWTGWGWNLVGGGQITRVVKGAQDEISTVGTPDLSTLAYLENIIDYSHYSDWNWPTSNSECNGYAVGVSPLGIGVLPNSNELVQQISEYYRPDEYYYNFNGRSGMFVLDPSSNAITIPFDNLKIEIEDCLHTIIITDENGYSYKFSSACLSEFGQVIFFPENVEARIPNSVAATTWYLSEIANPYDEIEFSFIYEGPYTTKSESPVVYSAHYTGNYHPTNFDGASLLFNNSNSYIIHEVISANGSRLKFEDDLEREDVIVPPNETLSINRSALTGIVSYDAEMNELSEVVLNYDYFKNENNGNERLKLISIGVKNVEEEVQITQEYFYDESIPLTMIESLAGRDHWGYYNGYESYNVETSFLNVNAFAVNPEFNQVGILKEIRSILGGRTLLNFETNTYTTSPNGTAADVLARTQFVSCSSEISGDDYYDFLDEDNVEVNCSNSSSNFGYVFRNPNNDNLHPLPIGCDGVFEIGDLMDLDNPETEGNQNTANNYLVYYPCAGGTWSQQHFNLTHEETISITGIISRSRNGVGNCLISIYSDEQTELFREGIPNGDVVIDEPLPLTAGTYTITTACLYPYFVNVAAGYEPWNFDESPMTASIEFLLDPVTIPTPGNGSAYAGGLRIESIVMDDGDDDQTNNQVNKYEYDIFEQPGVSSGYLFSLPNYESKLSDYWIQKRRTGLTCGGDIAQEFTSDLLSTYSTGMNSLVSANGSYVAYENVRTKTCSDDGNCLNGYVDQTYSIHPCEVIKPILQETEPYKHWRTGQPEKVSVYKLNDDLTTPQLISETEYEYEQVIAEPHLVGSLKCGVQSITAVARNRRRARSCLHDCENAPPSYTYYLESFNYVSELYLPIQTKSRIYDHIDPAKYVESISHTIYHETILALPSQIATLSSDPDTPISISSLKYVGDYDDTSEGTDDMSIALDFFNNGSEFGQRIPVEIIQYEGVTPTTLEVVGGEINTLRIESGKVVPDATWSLDIGDVIPLAQFNHSSIVDHAFAMDTRYRKVAHIETYDLEHRTTCVQEENDIQKTTLRDYSDGRIVAEVINASPNECAYTSFETENQGGWNYWQIYVDEHEFSHLGFIWPMAKTGSLAFHSENSQVSKEITAGSYIVSFWSKGDTFLVHGTDIAVTELISEEETDVDWAFYEYLVEYQGIETALLEIESNEGWIDELRFYPSDASMRTVVYNKDGSVKTECGINNRCYNYLYDSWKRLEWTFDDHLQIISHQSYYIQQHSTVNDFNWSRRQIILEEDLSKQDVLNASPANQSISSSIIYTDGFGRPIESIAIRQSPNSRDLVNFHEYNEFGQEKCSFAVCTADLGNDGEFIPLVDLKLRQLEFYDNTSKVVKTEFPWSCAEYERSPNLTVNKQGNVGEQWQLETDHVHTSHYLLNNEEEVLNWNLLASGVSAMDGNVVRFYPPNVLTKIVSTDEHGRETHAFKNLKGQLICMRSFVWVNGSGQHIYTLHNGNGESEDLGFPYLYGGNPALFQLDTYFVYDLLGQLICEIPPIAVNACESNFVILAQGTNSSIYDGYLAINAYDLRGRLVRSKKPNEGWSEYVYNSLNKVLLSHTPELGTDKWNFVKYDALGRPIQTGITLIEEERSILQASCDLLSTSLWESKIMGSSSAYSNESFPIISANDIYTETYYDDYNFDLNGFDFENYSVEGARGKKVRGGVTGELKRVLSDDVEVNYLSSVNYFDRNGRSLLTIEENILGGADAYESAYDFTGKLIDLNRSHQLLYHGDIIHIQNHFDYDHVGRTKFTWQKTGDDDWVALSKQIYNELGQVVNKHLHLTAEANVGMQNIDFRYNERGWLTKINNADLVNDGDNNEDYDVFGEELIYHEEDRFYSDDMLLIPQFNGNIAAIKWKTNKTFGGNFSGEDAATMPGHSYVFRYNDLGYMTGSYYASSSDIDPINYTYNKHFWDEEVMYDINGNILRIGRNRGLDDEGDDYSNAHEVDFINFSYSGHSNELISISDGADDDWANTYTHFIDNTGGTDYSYDEEGRMLTDANKHLTFAYNHLDLVESVQSGEESVSFIWDATGKKLAKIYSDHINYYIGGIEYNNEDLISITTSEGIARRTQLESNEDEWVYDYYLKDHLGNIRAVITNERSAITADKVTSETAKRLQEEMGFDNVDETAGMAPYLYPYDPSDPDNEMVADLNAFTGRIIGPSKLMSVREGETIDLSTNYWYHELPGENPISDLTEILAGILLNMGAASSGIIPAGPEAGMALLNNVNGTQFNALSGFLDDAFDEVDLTDPQAYLVYMFFDKNNMNIIAKNSGIIQVGEADQLGVISQKDLIMDRDGFFYVYVTNRSQLSVSFDNLEVKRWKPVVRVAYDYYPYGLTWENPALPGTEEGIHDCTYQDKEFQFGEFSDGHGLALYDFHARMYDGATGRWLVPDPAAQFANPYLAMGNNPVSMIDPDGRIANQIFDAFEYYSPIVLRPIAHGGTDQKGRGWEVSIGIPKAFGFSYRWEYGRVKYKNGFGNKNGTEVYKGAEVTYFGLVGFGGKHYQGDYGGGEFTQTTGTVTIGKPFANVKYENDIFPWSDNDANFMTKGIGFTLDNASLGMVPKPDRGDRYRSAGLAMSVYGLEWGFQLFTGDPGFDEKQRLSYDRGDGKFVYKPGLPGTDPDKYREGILYFGIGPIRIGRNCEANRHRIQNQFAHDNKVIQKNPRKTVPWFQIQQVPNNRYFYFGTGGGLGVY